MDSKATLPIYLSQARSRVRHISFMDQILLYSEFRQILWDCPNARRYSDEVFIIQLNYYQVVSRTLNKISTLPLILTPDTNGLKLVFKLRQQNILAYQDGCIVMESIISCSSKNEKNLAKTSTVSSVLDKLLHKLALILDNVTTYAWTDSLITFGWIRGHFRMEDICI